MKLIDLMQMYADKKVLPKKIIIHDNIVFDEDTIWIHRNNTFYCREYDGNTQFIFEYIVPDMLNDLVEIIEDTSKEDTSKEDKKIEKLDLKFDDGFIKEHFIGSSVSYLSEYTTLKMLYEKQCEIIDKINGEEK